MGTKKAEGEECLKKEWFVEPKKTFTLKDIVEINHQRKLLISVLDELNENYPSLERVMPIMPDGHVGECKCCKNIKERIDLLKRVEELRSKHPNGFIKRLNENGHSQYTHDPKREGVENRSRNARS